MAVSQAHVKASVKYNRSKDQITIRPNKETGQAIRQAAEREEMSLQQWILDKLQPYLTDE